MRERPIPLYGHEVRAIREGRKTQIRRVVNWRDVEPGLNLGFSGLQAVEQGSRGWVLTSMGGSCWEERCAPTPCPYGVPGDRLWVRETWQRFFEDEVPAGREHGPRDTMGTPARPDRKSFIYYRADGELVHPVAGRALWVTPLHMFRRMSRLTLEVKAVRVERLQEVSEADAEAEGIEKNWCGPLDKGPNGFGSEGWMEECGWIDYLEDEEGFPAITRIDSYRSLWDSINAKRGHGWASNPLVWVVEFERAEGAR